MIKINQIGPKMNQKQQKSTKISKMEIGKKIKIGKKVPGSQTDQTLTLGFSRVLLQKHDFWWFLFGFGLWQLEFCS